jgi:Flp pilus assembly protein protease CpaA
MRLIIVAGLLMGVSLAIQAAHSAKVGRAASADRVPDSAPWHVAMNAGAASALPSSSLILAASS